MSELIDVLLIESELQDDLLLRELLGEIEREATAVRPLPSAALVELMTPRRAEPRDTAARRAPRRSALAGRRVIITGVAVIGVLGLGVGAAAASPEARSAIGAGVAVIAHLFAPVNDVGAPIPTDGAAPSPSVGGSAEPTAVPSPEPSPGPSTAPTTEPTPDPTPGPSDGGAAASSGSSGGQTSTGSGSNSGSGSGSNSGSSGHSGDQHGNGKGNQSGHGNGKGQGNGGPAPTP